VAAITTTAGRLSKYIPFRPAVVQGLFTLVVGVDTGTSLTTDSVDLVHDEDDTQRETF